MDNPTVKRLNKTLAVVTHFAPILASIAIHAYFLSVMVAEKMISPYFNPMAKKKKNEKEQAEKGNVYDKILKENIAEFFLPLIEKELGIHIQKTEELKDKLQTTLEREADFLQEIIPKDGTPFILHLEFQTDDEVDMIYRMQEYHAILWKKYRKPIRQIVFYLGRNPSKMRSQLEEMEIFRGFELRILYEADYERFLDSQIPEEILFALLANFGEARTDQAVRKILDKLMQLKIEPIALQKYLRQLFMFARLRGNIKDIIHQELNNMAITYDIEQDSFYLQGIEKGIEKGREEGREEGEFKKAVATAEKCLLEGISVELTAKLTDLPLAEVKKIAQRLKG